MADETRRTIQAPVVLHDDDPGARRYATWLAEEFDTGATHHDAVDPAELVVAGTVVLVTGMRAAGGLGFGVHPRQLGGARRGRAPGRGRHGGPDPGHR